MKRSFNKLRQFGFNVPAHWVIARNEEGKMGAYGITDMIQGRKLNQISWENLSSDEKGHVREELDKWYASSFKYLFDIHKQGGYYLYDLFDDRQFQWMYGKKKEDNENHIYLVDIDLEHQRLIAQGGKPIIYAISQVFKEFTKDEKKIGPLERARAIINQMKKEDNLLDFIKL